VPGFAIALAWVELFASIQTCTYISVDSLRSPSITSVSTAIDLRHVRYFLAVSEELHFGRAARRLHLSQPPLSQAIRKLEDELGVRLLDRTSRSVALTDAGRVFAEEGRKMLAAFQLAVEETRRAGGTAATLRIGWAPALPVALLLRYVEALRERAPDLFVRVAHLYTPEQVTRLRSGELDLTIAFDPGHDPELEKEPLPDGERVVAYIRSDHALAAKCVIGPGDVRQESLVTSPRSTNASLYDQTLLRFTEAGYRFKRVVEAEGATWPDLLVAVASGQGIALAPASLHDVDDVGDMVVCRDLDPELHMPATVLAWRADAPPALKGILETARQVARDLWASSDAG
jgi:DNA-binding transcriptional LysR family regulator